MNPFDQLLALSASRVTDADAGVAATPTPGVSKTGRLRACLKTGPKNVHELSKLGNVSVTLVSALLANDIRKGRVIRSAAGVFELSAGYDAELQREIAEAVAFLRQHGGAVTFSTG